MMLVFGRNGQVARELARLVPDAAYLGRDDVNLADPDACAAAIHARKPHVVINAAAYTAVDRAEEKEDLAHLINAKAPASMAQACRALAIPLVHISTDYVFDGTGDQPFSVEHPTASLGAYGRTKLEGEGRVRAAAGAYVILRTSWVFSRYGSNFVKTMLRLGAERDILRVVADQIGRPTPARAVAQACLTIAEALQTRPETSGTYHFSGAPDTSWAGFARRVMSSAGLSCKIEDIATHQYPTPAPRPLNSRLDCAGLEVFGLERPDWHQGLKHVSQELKGIS